MTDQSDWNDEMLLAFAAPFKEMVQKMQGGMNIQRTQAVNGMAVPDGCMAAVFDRESNSGITAIAFGRGTMKAYIEVCIDPKDGVTVLSSVIDSRCALAGEIFAKAFREYIEKCRAFAT